MPWFASQEKYVLPWTVPLFFPLSSSKMTPIHLPVQIRQSFISAVIRVLNKQKGVFDNYVYFPFTEMNIMILPLEKSVVPTYATVPSNPLSVSSTRVPALTDLPSASLIQQYRVNQSTNNNRHYGKLHVFFPEQ